MFCETQITTFEQAREEFRRLSESDIDNMFVEFSNMCKDEKLCRDRIKKMYPSVGKTLLKKASFVELQDICRKAMMFINQYKAELKAAKQ